MYKGLPFNIPLGNFGIHSDDPHPALSPGELIIANNITLENTRLEKAFGSARYNNTSLGSGVVAAIDWWPDDNTQQFIAVTRDGSIWQLPDIQTITKITSTNTALVAGQTPTNTTAVTNLLIQQNQPCIIQGGAEAQGNSRKLFVLSGNDCIQVIKGNSTKRYNISLPSADWSGRNWPSFGLIHDGRLMVWGCPNNPHQVYASSPENHEDFQTFGGLALNITVYPGDGQRIISGSVYKGRLFWFKFPRGVYYLDDSDPNTANWNVFKYSDSFGASSSFSACQPLDDMLVANNYGSITSFKAVQYYGGFEMADVLRNSRASKYVRDYMQASGLLVRQCIYYEYKKLCFFSYQSSQGILSDRILVIDFNQENPRILWYDKDQPNCLGLRRDFVSQVQKPFYGCEDGFIYLMDQEDRNVGGAGFNFEFMTPHHDFHQMSSLQSGYQTSDMGQKNKLFDMLTVEFEQTGNWSLNLDIYIDGRFTETIQCGLATKKGLGEFALGVDRLYSGAPDKIQLPLHGMGKTIAIRGYDNGAANQNIRLLSMTVWFRPAGQEQTKDDS